MPLAFLTVALLREPFGSPVVQGFLDRIEGVFASAEASPGFLDRPRSDGEWGEICVPSHFEPVGTPLRLPTTLTLWQDLESVAAFSYRGAHGEALTKRREWFVPPVVPGYVAYWVAGDHRPTFEEACVRWDILHQSGPTPQAFDFKRPFCPEGQPYELDRARIKALGTIVP